jgi:hypothetical protein
MLEKPEGGEATFDEEDDMEEARRTPTPTPTAAATTTAVAVPATVSTLWEDESAMENDREETL